MIIKGPPEPRNLRVSVWARGRPLSGRRRRAGDRTIASNTNFDDCFSVSWRRARCTGDGLCLRSAGFWCFGDAWSGCVCWGPRSAGRAAHPTVGQAGLRLRWPPASLAVRRLTAGSLHGLRPLGAKCARRCCCRRGVADGAPSLLEGRCGRCRWTRRGDDSDLYPHPPPLFFQSNCWVRQFA